MRKLIVFTMVAAFSCSAALASTQDDIVAWRGGASDWFMSHTKDAQPMLMDPLIPQAVGAPGDVHPVVGDVNGDGVDDIAILRDDGSQWSWLADHSSIGAGGVGSLGDGTNWSGIPDLGWPSVYIDNFLGNVNGNGGADAFDDAVHVENDNGTLFWRAAHSTASGLDATTISTMWWGNTGDDIPLLGDFNGDGNEDATIFRQSTGDWNVALSTAAGLNATSTAFGNFGTAGDIPLVGDMNGDGRDDGVIARADANGNLNWFVGYSDASGNVAGAGWADLGWFGDIDGASGSFADTPIIADINGDGTDDIGVYRNWPAGNSQWFFQFTGGGSAGGTFAFDGDLPLIGQFDVVPEPSSIVLLSLGAVAFVLRRRR